jgi:CheY-like chemotaxis protein
MIVDDAPDNLLLLEMILEDSFDIIQADSGQACLDLIVESVPDLLLLDVNMPGLNGYDVCTKLRTDPKTQVLPIIFVSAMVNTEERLAGFEAGGDEYINKPVDAGLLLEKIDFQLARQIERNSGQQDASEAMEVAMQAMTSSSELGELISFVTKAQSAATLDEIGQMMVEVCRVFGLTACVHIVAETPAYFGCDAESIEATVLQRSLSSDERIINLGIRTIVKSEQLSLLVKNMPVNDENKYGRFKDHLAVLISIADGRILTIKSQLSLSSQRKTMLGTVIQHTEKKIKEVNTKITDYDDYSRKVMMDMVSKLEVTLFSLGLDEDQEDKLMKLVYGTSDELEKSKEATKNLQKELGGVLEGLYEILARSD